MNTRTLYLTRSLSKVGRGAFTGRRMFDALSAISDAAVLSHQIIESAAARDALVATHPDLDSDLMTCSEVAAFDPNVIFLEGGLEPGRPPEHTWKFPRELLERHVRAGAVAFIADVGHAEITGFEGYRAAYYEAAPQLGARIEVRPLVSESPEHQHPIYGSDQPHALHGADRQFFCHPEQMLTSDWLQPVYDGIDRILVGDPVSIIPSESALASGNGSSTQRLLHDVFVDPYTPFRFASVRKLGDGYIVFIAGEVSHDLYTQECPGNLRWITNTAEFLRQEIGRDARRYAFLRELRRMQEDADTAQASPETFQSVLEEAQAVVTSGFGMRAESASQQLASLFGARWAELGEKTRAFLTQGEVHRRLLEDEGGDVESFFGFNIAIASYGWALESELRRRLFLPFQTQFGPEALPAEPEDSQLRMSWAALRRFAKGGKPPELATMAYCLRNVGLNMANAEGNGFAEFVEDTVHDTSSLGLFCDQVIDFAEKFRNDISHANRLMTHEDCLEARRALLLEPIRLLVALSSTTQPPEA